MITCPLCGHKEEVILTDSCQFFYQCRNCNKMIRPKGQDCCIFCSYVTVPSPSI
ncbi:GDCCVxC domain-containing (seleno)protein [Poseidonibacter ostreae]|uniref:GDCCVxC domain-containing (seleno)protein n=1 Tax=Poseidonibacter ostreae TaxID=2654171 RepID=UPI0027E43C02|nr:GDCCVxC domain-containing (seleno)protein [Poseidonibacter ostreae]